MGKFSENTGGRWEYSLKRVRNILKQKSILLCVLPDLHTLVKIHWLLKGNYIYLFPLTFSKYSLKGASERFGDPTILDSLVATER